MSLKTKWYLLRWKFEDLWDKYVGKDKNRDAIRIQKESEQLLEQEKKRVDEEESQIVDHLNEIFRGINKVKRDILVDSFSDLENILSQLKDVVIPTDLRTSEYKNTVRSVDEYISIYESNRQSVVNFDNEKGKIFAKAFFTFGIATRKEGQESLNKAKINQDSIKNLIAEMNADLEKMKRCRDSARQIYYYFRELKDLFNNTLQYLQHSIHYLQYSSMRITKKANEAISVTLLPKDLQNRLEATLILATVLSKLIKEKIIYDDEKLSEQQEKTKQEFNNIMSNSELGKCLYTKQ